MAVSARTRGGLLKCRPARPGDRVAVVAPASAIKRDEFFAGIDELKRLGFVPVFDDRALARDAMVAGPAALRAASLLDAWRDPTIAAVVSVRGGYGSVELLDALDAAAIVASRAPLVGYSDITSLHSWITCQIGMTTIHGAMLQGRLSTGVADYDPATFVAALSTAPLGEQAPAGLETLLAGDVSGPLYGGTLTQLVGSLGTPWAFDPPQGAVLFLDEVTERPYRIRRMLVQLQQSGVLARIRAIVCGQFPRCDEPNGQVTARGVVAAFFKEFSGPVLFGFPAGHTVTPLISIPLGVSVRVDGGLRPCLVFDEAAAAA